ncbi:MAG: hypothetical protein AB1679_12235 [Actinomycetota bacterium]
MSDEFFERNVLILGEGYVPRTAESEARAKSAAITQQVDFIAHQLVAIAGDFIAPQELLYELTWRVEDLVEKRSRKAGAR